MSTVTLSDKGRIVLPADVRRALGISKGAQLEIHMEAGRAVVSVASGKTLKPGSGYGLAKGKIRRQDDDADAIGKAMADAHAFD